jgi:hypothetical protein
MISRFFHMYMLMLLMTQSRAAKAGALEAYVEELNKQQSACSACNLVSRTLDAEAFSSKLVQAWKDATPAERSKELRKSLGRACKSIGTLDIGASRGVNDSLTFIDLLDMKKVGMHEGFENTERGPAVTLRVQLLCKHIARERTGQLVELMETWRTARKGRRLVDFRFNTDSKMCSGGVLSVCESVFTGDPDRPKAGDEGADDDHEEL